MVRTRMIHLRKMRYSEHKEPKGQDRPGHDPDHHTPVRIGQASLWSIR